MSAKPSPFLMVRCARQILSARDADDPAIAALQGNADGVAMRRELALARACFAATATCLVASVMLRS